MTGRGFPAAMPVLTVRSLTLAHEAAPMSPR
jgi:hypothetical protein